MATRLFPIGAQTACIKRKRKQHLPNPVNLET